MSSSPAPAVSAFTPYHITRPAPVLMWYYVLCALLTGPISPLVVIPLWIRYSTLRYKFDDKGISMTWGIVFRREVLLTYRRIQDIHLTHNLVQRWLGLATVAIQTASGTATAEMGLEGILEAEPLRDFLYQQMRGARGDAIEHPPAVAEQDDALTLLREIRDALEALTRRAKESP